MAKSGRTPEEEEAFSLKRKEDGRALGERLRSARKLSGLTLQEVADKMEESGISARKATVGHWETGTAIPDSLQIRRLAKVYNTTTDALLWDDSLSIDAIQLAAQFDGLTEESRRMFKVMWMAYFKEATSDDDVSRHLPSAPKDVESIKRKEHAPED